ncbi:MAG: cation diffusion facilitator family transporter [Acidimicrobiia bacterium]
MAEHESKTAIIAALIANLGIAIAKFVAFAITGATAMLAEGVHSLADTGNQGLLFLGIRRSKKAPDVRHPFGYGTERFFWAFVVALVLFSLGALFSLYEGLEKLADPHEIESPGWAIGTLIVAFILESGSLRTAIRESRPLKGDHSWFAFIRRARNPELPVVLLEDTGALLGLLIALVGISMAVITGNAIFDTIATLCISALLGVIAIILAIEMKSLLIGESATRANEETIVAAITDGREVERIIHLRTLHLGPDELLLATKLHFATRDVEVLAQAIDTVEARVRAALPETRVIYIEPDLYRTPAETAADGSADPDPA